MEDLKRIPKHEFSPKCNEKWAYIPRRLAISSEGIVSLIGHCHLRPSYPAPSRHRGRNFSNAPRRGESAYKQKTIMLGIQDVPADIQWIVDHAKNRRKALRVRNA